MATLDENTQIGVDGNLLAGTFITPATLVPGVLFVHGWGGSQQQYLARAREIAALGCICLTFDLRGHALTRPQFETVSRAANLADVLAAYDTLARHRHVDPSAIAVVGSSYGGYLSAILTTLRPVRWLALRAPALYIDSGWDLPKLQLHKEQDLRNYRRRQVTASENRALKACQAFRGDLLLVQSEHDDIVPAAVLTSYREAATSTRSISYRLLDGADHGLSQESDQQAYSAVLLSWLGEMLNRSRSTSRPPPAAASTAAPADSSPAGAPAAVPAESALPPPEPGARPAATAAAAGAR